MRITQKGVPINGIPYHERDYAFGQTILTLRTKVGKTQTGLADFLGISRRALGDWEAGKSYPNTEHLKKLIALAIEQKAFPVGHETEAVHALWQAAHQKVLIDEAWLDGLLSSIKTPLSARLDEESFRTGQAHIASLEGPQVNWGDAPSIPSFYGREWELNLLNGWVVEEHCRVVSVVGQGGIGKSALSVNLMHQVAKNFKVVIWRSLRDVPSFDVLLVDLLQILEPEEIGKVTDSPDRRQSTLLEKLRSSRILLVLDNFESVLGDGESAGHIISGYDGFRRLLIQVAQTEHQSCLLLTSREKPIDLVPLEGNQAPVRTLRLARLDADACEKLLTEQEVRGSAVDLARLIDIYGGNPLALKIVAHTIVDLFEGEIAPFLQQGEVIYGSIRELLDQQFIRLLPLEQNVLLWLAILREPATLNEILAVLSTPVPRSRLLEAIEALRRCSLIERGQGPGSFTLQSVVLEYATAQLIADMSNKIMDGRPAGLSEHGLELAHAPEYVRQTQERLLVIPILDRLRGVYPEVANLETLLIECLNQLRRLANTAQGYAPANLVVFLRVLRGHLRRLDLSGLLLRGVSLHGVEMQDSVLTGASIRDTTFTDTFEGITSLSISDTGTYWAATSRSGEVRVWEAGGLILFRLWQALPNSVAQVALSSDGQFLAGGCFDGTIKLWDVTSGRLIWTSKRDMRLTAPNRLAFSRDGSTLAVADADGTVCLWDQAHGRLLGTLVHHQLAPTIVWHNEREVLASGDISGAIYLWGIHQKSSPTILKTIKGHEQRVMGLAFSPEGNRLASASWDGTVKVWDSVNGSLQETLTEHRDGVQRVAWSMDGQVIASADRSGVIWLWDVEKHRYRAALRGHTAVVRGLAFTPDGHSLVSGSDDGTIRVWDAVTGACIRIIQGYSVILWDISWSPDGQYLVSIGSEPVITLYTLHGDLPPRTLHGHNSTVICIDWSRNGRFIASDALSENTIRLWDGNTGEALESLHYPDDPSNTFRGLAWSPDGSLLAAGTNTHGVQLFDITTRSVHSFGDNAPDKVESVEWSPYADFLAAICNDGIYIWNAASGMLLHKLSGHHTTLAWSANSRWLASSENNGSSGEIFFWDSSNGTRMPLIIKHPCAITTLRWVANDEFLISGGRDGVLRWWDIQTGECIRQIEAHQGYVGALKISPDGTRVASCGDDGVIGFRDVRTGELLKTLRRDRPYERLDISGIRGLNDAQKATLFALGAIDKSSDISRKNG